MLRRGEHFLTPELHSALGRRLDGLEDRLVENGEFVYQWDRLLEDLNAEHGKDFIGKIIPETIARVRNRHPDQPARILDLGGGLSLVAAEIRKNFGKAVQVYTTMLNRPVAAEKRRQMVETRRGKVWPLKKDNIIASLPAELDARDGKWRSIEELTDYPEFDLMLDTYGELYYATVSSGFKVCYMAAVRKLQVGGELHIARLENNLQYEAVQAAANSPANTGKLLTMVSPPYAQKPPIMIRRLTL